MFELNLSNNQIIIKRNTVFLGIGIVAMVMAIMGFRLLFGLLPFEEGYTFSDVFGLIFVCVWTLIVLSMGIFAFATNSKQITINNDGVLCKSWLHKTFVKWTDIKDWGLSYCGQTRFEGNTYYLYFSEHECPIKNDCEFSIALIKAKLGSHPIDGVKRRISFATNL